MKSIEDGNKFKKKWWLHPMDPENMGELSESDQKNAKRFNMWLSIWGLMFFGVVIGIKPIQGGIEATSLWRLLLVSSPLIPSIFLVRAFIRLFSEMKDELLKKIYYGALAVGFLFAFIIGISFALSAAVIGASAKAGPLMFAGLLIGYNMELFLKCRKYNAQ